MNFRARLTIIAACIVCCAGGAVIATSAITDGKIDNHAGGSSASDLFDEYRYATGDAPQTLRFREIESIIRRDPTAKSHDARIEFGSVKMEHGAAIVQVLFIQPDGATKAFLYKLIPDSTTWKVASAQRLWFVPRTYLLRGVRA